MWRSLACPSTSRTLFSGLRVSTHGKQVASLLARFLLTAQGMGVSGLFVCPGPARGVCRLSCINQDSIIWFGCHGGDAKCVYTHPRLGEVRRIHFTTLWGKVDLQNHGNVKELLITYPSKDFIACHHVINRNHDITINKEICVSFECVNNVQ